MNHDCDALVLGGGPAGCAAAITLAGKGRRVLLLEKEKFPRYHIGESLIPYTYFPLQRLGFLPVLERSPFVRKYSVQFVSTNGKQSQPFYFRQHFTSPAADTWQVTRGEFDLMLLNHARSRGVEVREETRAREFRRDERGAVVGVVAVPKDGAEYEVRAPITIDATGRDALAISRYHWRLPDAHLKKVALWTYYQGAQRDPGLDAGATTVAYVPGRGWFWYIPQENDIISVGVVADRERLFGQTRDPATVFAREVSNNRWVQDHLAVGRNLEKYQMTGDFSYHSRHCAMDGLVLAGDAFAFLDPVFSSGVCLALWGGEAAAETAEGCLQAGDFRAARFRDYGAKYTHRLASMRNLVYAFYDEGFSWRAFFAKHPDMKFDATDCLIGNLQRDYGALAQAMGEFARLPPPYEHGTPLADPATAK